MEFGVDKIVVEERSSLQSRVPAVQGYSVEEGAEMPMLFENNVAGHVSQGFSAYNPKSDDCINVEGRSISICRLQNEARNVLCNLVEEEQRRGRRQKEFENTCGRTVRTAAKTDKIVGNRRRNGFRKRLQ